MTESGSDGVTLIGLHSLAPVNDRVAVPELQALISLRRVFMPDGNVIAFPREATRPPGDIPAAIFGRDAATGRNVVAFAPPVGKSPECFRKA